MPVANGSRGCLPGTGVPARCDERGSRDTSEDASFAAPLLHAEVESLVLRLLRRRSSVA
jgi:hypothetical protein